MTVTRCPRVSGIPGKTPLMMPSAFISTTNEVTLIGDG
jgi:hypothetical protein